MLFLSLAEISLYCHIFKILTLTIASVQRILQYNSVQYIKPLFFHNWITLHGFCVDICHRYVDTSRVKNPQNIAKAVTYHNDCIDTKSDSLHWYNEDQNSSFINNSTQRVQGPLMDKGYTKALMFYVVCITADARLLLLQYDYIRLLSRHCDVVSCHSEKNKNCVVQFSPWPFIKYNTQICFFRQTDSRTVLSPRTILLWGYSINHCSTML